MVRPIDCHAFVASAARAEISRTGGHVFVRQIEDKTLPLGREYFAGFVVFEVIIS